LKAHGVLIYDCHFLIAAAVLDIVGIVVIGRLLAVVVFGEFCSSARSKICLHLEE
jgi:predicted membrane protein